MSELTFIEAAKAGDIVVLKKCLHEGVKIHTADGQGETALHKACSNGMLDSVKFLIKQGANVNACSKENITPLHLATEAGHFEVVKELLKNNADPNVKTSEHVGKDTPLHWLVKDERKSAITAIENIKKIVALLHEHGAKFGATNSDGETVLHLACDCEDYVEIVKQLKQLMGKDVDIQDKEGKTALARARIKYQPGSVLCNALTNTHEVVADGGAIETKSTQINIGQATGNNGPAQIVYLTSPTNATLQVNISDSTVVVGDNATLNIPHVES